MSVPAIKGWKYINYKGDLPATNFNAFETFIVLWQSKIKNGVYPSWQDFKFEELEEWWGCMSLADIKQDPLDLEFKLWGTSLTTWWGIDYTKKKMSDSYEQRDDNWKQYEGPFFQTLINTEGIGMVGGTLRVLDREFITVQGIDVLLTTNGSISQVFSSYKKMDEEQPEFPASGIIKEI